MAFSSPCLRILFASVTFGLILHLAGCSKKADPVPEAAPLRHESAIERANDLAREETRAATALMSLNSTLSSLKDLPGARKIFEETLALRRKQLGDEHPDTLAALGNLGSLLFWGGDLAAAQSYLEEAWLTSRKVSGDEHAVTLEFRELLVKLVAKRNDVGALLRSQGDYAAARAHFEQSLALKKKLFGEEHRNIGVSLSHLGQLHMQQGDHAVARSYLEQSLVIIKKIYGDDHFETGLVLSVLGNAAGFQRDFAAGRTYLEQALAIKKRSLGDKHIETGKIHNDLGYHLACAKDHESALIHLEKALAIIEEHHGKDHPNTANPKNNLAGLLWKKGDREKARIYAEQSLAIRVKTLGEEHSNTANSHTRLGEFDRASGNDAAARSHFEKALAVARRAIDRYAAIQSEREQLAMADNLITSLHNFLSLPSTTKSQTEAAYKEILAWKGSVMVRQQRLRFERQNPHLAPLFAELRTTAGKLANLANAVPDPKNREAWNRELERLTAAKESLERELAQKSGGKDKDQASQKLTPEVFRELLPPGTVLVDFVVYRRLTDDPDDRNTWITPDHLTAFFVKPGADVVRIEFGPLSKVDPLIEAWRSGTRKQPGTDHPGIELRRLFWEPIEKHIAGAKVVLLSPDGALGRLPFAALPSAKPGSYLLEEVPLAVVPVPRLLPSLLGQTQEPGDPSLLLVGDVDFDAMPGKGNPTSRVAESGERGARASFWQQLAGTRGEIATIRTSFEKHFAADRVKTLRGGEASEASLRELAPKHSILHLATHGFFAPPDGSGTAEGKQTVGLFGKDGAKSFHPGLLSGLVLAGANRPVDPAQDDGILTSVEVAELDLSKVQLAVLSACETGLGKSAGGEGVLGLQRAFQVAGAKTTITSLWSVPDEPTRILMERFYANLWDKSKPMTKLEALREAQLWMLREGRTYPGLQRGLVRDDEPKMEMLKGRLPPYYWAAFVLGGDWR